MAGAPNRIKELREAAMLSLDALAERSGVGKNALNLIERGKQELTLDKMRRISAAMGLRPAALLNDEDVEYRPGPGASAVFDVLRAVDPEYQADLARAAQAILDIADAIAMKRNARTFEGDDLQVSELAQLWNGMDRDRRDRAVGLLTASGLSDEARRFRR